MPCAAVRGEGEKREGEKKSFSLPLDDASDDWMLDDDVGTMTMEDEEEPKSRKEEHANVENKKPQSDGIFPEKEAPSAEEAAVPKKGSSTEEKPAAPKEEPQSQKKSKKNKSKKK